MGFVFTLAVCAGALLSPFWIYRPIRTAKLDSHRKTRVQVIDLLAGTAVVAVPMSLLGWYLRQIDERNPPNIDWNFGSLTCFGSFVMIFVWLWWSAVVRLSKIGIETAWRRFLLEITVPIAAVLVIALPMLGVLLVDAVQAHGWIDYRTSFRLNRFALATGITVLLGVLTRLAVQWGTVAARQETEPCPVTPETSLPRQ